MMLSLAAMTLLLATDDRTPAQPPRRGEDPARIVVPPQPSRRGEAPDRIVTPRAWVLVRHLEEEVELLDAQLNTKKAYVEAEKMMVVRAEKKLPRLAALLANKAIDSSVVELAEMDVQVAKAQMQIRMAEMNEVEVRLRQAKRRLEEAKGSGGRRDTPPPPAPRTATPTPPQPRR